MRGATLGADHGNDGGCDFNPRTPCGVRRGKNSTSTRRGLFQSTHPMRGATIIFVQCVPQLSFQSTHPMRGATERRFLRHVPTLISIHAPHAGCDGAGRRRLVRKAISIHAPHAGCDGYSHINRLIRINFNPRTPCGVRLLV